MRYELYLQKVIANVRQDAKELVVTIILRGDDLSRYVIIMGQKVCRPLIWG